MARLMAAWAAPAMTRAKSEAVQLTLRPRPCAGAAPPIGQKFAAIAGSVLADIGPGAIVFQSLSELPLHMVPILVPSLAKAPSETRCKKT